METRDEIEFEITFTAFVSKSPTKTISQQIESLIDDLNEVIHEKHPNINADAFGVAQQPTRKEQQ